MDRRKLFGFLLGAPVAAQAALKGDYLAGAAPVPKLPKPINDQVIYRPSRDISAFMCSAGPTVHWNRQYYGQLPAECPTCGAPSHTFEDYGRHCHYCKGSIHRS